MNYNLGINFQEVDVRGSKPTLKLVIQLSKEHKYVKLNKHVFNTYKNPMDFISICILS